MMCPFNEVDPHYRNARRRGLYGAEHWRRMAAAVFD